MKRLIPNSSTILLLFIAIFLSFIFISYKLLFKNIYDNHSKNQQLTFNLIQRESSDLLTKLLYDYTKQRNILLEKHKLVLDYLKNNRKGMKYSIPILKITRQAVVDDFQG